jgi:hypothetical protein
MQTGLEQFEANWEKAFKPNQSKPREGDMLREVNYDGMWNHSCTVDMSVVWIGKNETCDLCGAWEEDGQ